MPFYRRSQELDLLKQWILTKQSRSIIISGTAGIGKTALARQLLEDIKDEFDEIVWQSLGCQRSVVEFIDRNLLASLNIEALPEPPLDLEARLSLLLEHFREHRCWIILDDLDRLFSSAEFCKYQELFLTEDIKSLLNQQFSRLSTSEQEVIKFLAGEDIPLTIARSIESLSLSPADVGNEIVSLVRRGLVDRTETKDGAFFGVRSRSVSEGYSIVKQFISQL